MTELIIQDLLPARMLNEFTYCPRLAYLEWVQGEWADNAFTLDGEFVHRNADRPDRQELPVPEGEDPPVIDKLHARSLKLESAELGLVAVIDVLEIEGSVATPIDYKRSLVPNTPEQSYEPERVQVCAQALLLRTAGYTCNEGIIWYAGSRRRVTIIIDEPLIERTRQLIAECKIMAKGGRMPLPLVDSPKCPRCSLVTICLPDETNMLIHDSSPVMKVEDPTPIGPPRLLLPPRPESVPLHVSEPGAKVGKKADRLYIELKGKTLAEVRLKDVSHVCLFGPVQISTQCIHELLDREIPICYFTTGGWFRGMAQGMPHKNIELRIQQYAKAASSDSALTFAKAFVSGKIRNARTLLRRNLPGDSERVLNDLNDSAREAESATSLGSLLGIEGMAAKRYFAAFPQLLKAEHEFQFDGRNRRPPTDPVNAVLSFLYSLLAREMTSAILSAGLDPYLGFLHQPRYGRPALALDIAEEFRPILADSTALSLFNTAELRPEHFIKRAGSVSLTPYGRKTVITAWERRLAIDVTHPIFGYTISYRRILMVQARLLARVISGELGDYPAFKTR